MNKKKARATDSLMCLIQVIAGGICFGIWQHSVAAAWFAGIVLSGLFNIGWSIEYGDMDYESDVTP